MFESEKNCGYSLNVHGVEYWNRTMLNGIEVFIKNKIDIPYELYLDKIGGNENLSHYIDIVTGRPFCIVSLEENLIIIPSGICVSKKDLYINNNVLDVATEILGSNVEESYTNISENIIYYNYFCDVISKRNNLNVIPADIVYEEAREFKKKENIKNFIKKKIEN